MLLNNAKHGELRHNINLPDPERNRFETGNYANSIMCSTVAHLYKLL